MLIQVKEAHRLDPDMFPMPDYSHIGNGNVPIGHPRANSTL